MAWECITGWDAQDCITDHWLPPLKGRMEPSGGRAPCRRCNAKRPPISIQVKNGRLVWDSHCECNPEDIGQDIAAAVPCYTHRTRRPRKPPADLEEIRALVLDRDVTVNALRLGVLEALGMSSAEAAEILKLPRKTLSDARRKLATNRRSRGRRILATVKDPPVAKTRHKPQVRGPDKAA